MANAYTSLAAVASELRDLATNVAAELDEAVDAGGEFVWIGPAADRYRYSIGGHRATVEQVAADLLVAAARVELAIEEREQELQLMGAG